MSLFCIKFRAATFILCLCTTLNAEAGAWKWCENALHKWRSIYYKTDAYQISDQEIRLSILRTERSLKRKWPLVREMHSDYFGETSGTSIALRGYKVKYISSREARHYMLHLYQGRVFGSDGFLMCPLGCRGMFVMDPWGRIYFSTQKKGGSFHHSSLINGQAVAGAGSLYIKSGVIHEMGLSSGHYRPDWSLNFQVLLQFQKYGILPIWIFEGYESGKWTKMKDVLDDPSSARSRIADLPWEDLK